MNLLISLFLHRVRMISGAADREWSYSGLFLSFLMIISWKVVLSSKLERGLSESDCYVFVV